MKTVFVVAVALMNVEGKILIARRPEGKAMAGLWEFPGGKVEAGETPEAALIRELREELGIIVRQEDLQPLTFTSHSYEATDDRSAFHLFMPLYACRTWQGTPQPHEHSALTWVNAEKLGDYPMPEADVPLCEFLSRYEL